MSDNISTQSLYDSKMVKIPTKEIWIGWISSLVEAYNMAIYSFVAPLLAGFLFQKASQERAILFSYILLFIGSSLLYPLGALYYGFMGDKGGRKKTCIYSSLGLALATGMMGFIPLNYSSESAWIYFLVLICIQNFFSGGEYYGSIVFTLEHSKTTQTGFMSALSCLFAVFGLVAANGIATIALSEKSELWLKSCFILGGIGGVVSYLLKNHCHETPVFASIQHKKLNPTSLSQFIKSHWLKIATAIMVVAFFIVSYTFIFIFLPLMPFDSPPEDNFNTFQSLMFYGIFLVLAGRLADRIQIERAIFMGMCLFAILVIPLCKFCSNLFVLQLVLTACACFVIAPIHTWMLNQFEPQNRCRGIFISSAIATSLFGGSTAPICLLIYENTQSVEMCGIYPLCIALTSLFCLTPNLKTLKVIA